MFELLTRRLRRHASFRRRYFAAFADAAFDFRRRCRRAMFRHVAMLATAGNGTMPNDHP